MMNIAFSNDQCSFYIHSNDNSHACKSSVYESGNLQTSKYALNSSP